MADHHHALIVANPYILKHNEKFPKLMLRLSRIPNTIPKYRQDCNLMVAVPQLHRQATERHQSRGPLAKVYHICSDQNY
ncbi:hypothetical protein BCON_0129g00160 [Botryotinia convoluta]|uniref:Uncharacterized protein n=1 Tax=Botryotinia convoluta TaxID=54673 RepID=A0A4Z1HWN5_9HELO|nr:hypothetical protein BCON_0129g00160 [Botryotinia convoluta]